MASNKDQEKQAAVGLLVDAGIDFENAVMAVEKKASELEKSALTSVIGGPAMGYVGAKKGDKLGGTLTGLATGSVGATAGMHAAGLKGAVAGSLAGGFLGGKAYSAAKHLVVGKDHETEKKAAVDMLINHGVDFETAVQLVSAKAAELA